MRTSPYENLSIRLEAIFIFRQLGADVAETRMNYDRCVDNSQNNEALPISILLGFNALLLDA